MTPSARYERPVIGVSAYEEAASWGVWSVDASLVPVNYVQSLARAGAQAVILPIQAEDGDLDNLVRRLDAVVFTGGPDVDPDRYGAEPHPRSQAPRHERDRRELALLEAADARELPVLAICRGMQLLNVARGGTLHQHLPDLVGHDEHAPTAGEYTDHAVWLEPGSGVHRALGWEKAGVPAHHHQAIDGLGRGLVAVGWADDGTIEAIEDPDRLFLLGVQWHPEAGTDLGLFEALVSAAGGVASHTDEDAFPHEP